MKPPPTNLIRLCGLFATGDLGPYTVYTRPLGHTVIFLSTSPRTSPTFAAQHQRNKLRGAAFLWRLISQAERDHYAKLARDARLRIGGYQLFSAEIMLNDSSFTHTLERRR